MSQHTHFDSQWLLQTFFGPHKVAQINLVAQCRNIPILSRNGCYIFFWATQSLENNFGCTIMQHTHFESQWFLQTFFGRHKVAQITSVAQCRNIPFLIRNGCYKFFWATQSRANNFDCTMSQHTHFESQWLLQIFLGHTKSRK